MSQQHPTGTAARVGMRAGLALLLLRTAAGCAICALVACTTTTTTTTSFAPPGAESEANNTDAAAINVQLGVDYLQKNELALAQTKLQRALREDPRSADVHDALALLDEQLGDARGADREYRRALELSAHGPRELNNYAVFLCSHGRAAEGVRYFEEAASNRLYPTPWAAYTNAGICLRGVRQNAAAMQRFLRALQVNPTFADAAYEAASLEYAEQDYAAARSRVDSFLMNNRPTAALLLLGWQVARAQSDVLAEQRYALLLARDFPNSPQAHALELSRRGGAD
ncbi:MAG TPA: type IV pilus biogenesis/stability protein PilW [Steroidobacteraceae bacterium]|nr:type IV pilus biogenesis/stability protein PilW [Steroidobacteraceae bacterium]